MKLNMESAYQADRLLILLTKMKEPTSQNWLHIASLYTLPWGYNQLQ